MTDISTGVDPNFESESSRDFESLARNGYKRIFALAFSMLGNVSDAEDATQETFIRAWRHIDQYDSKHPFQNWLAAIARNHIKDFLRKHRPRTTLSLDFLSDVGIDGRYFALQAPDRSSDPESTAISNESVELFRRAIARLHEPYQSVLTLHDFNGHSYSEIARMLQCPMGTVRSRLHRGRAIVRQTLEQYHPALADVSP